MNDQASDTEGTSKQALCGRLASMTAPQADAPAVDAGRPQADEATEEGLTIPLTTLERLRRLEEFSAA
ncbi:hypothetical protein Sa4125_16200 [Aureimonas sp. SA4125]|uniref:hypothetical protein n=1 Tax=Aureimonas sp. SA4125 TaxID=2826993 RepID=UPI001CC46A3F|nr:hypothetical protein [Aureimonas sp. SA4125]BDA84078.1 hypothetical protein Sa4125_16200 [Aureimonas sp. SA4125]